MNNVVHCHRCLRAAGRTCDGPCPCPHGNTDISRHVELSYCPHPDGPRFGDGRMPLAWLSRGLGDTVKKVLDAPVIHAIVKAVKPRSCGKCAKRQRKMNEAVPYKS